MENLTKDDISILMLASKGYNNEKIAKELYMSYHTVKSHISKILIYLNASDRTNAVYIASKLGLI